MNELDTPQEPQTWVFIETRENFFSSTANPSTTPFNINRINLPGPFRAGSGPSANHPVTNRDETQTPSYHPGGQEVPQRTKSIPLLGFSRVESFLGTQITPLSHYKQLKPPLWVPWWPSSERLCTNNSESVAAIAPSPRDLFLAGVGTLESSRAGRCWRVDGPPGDRNRKRHQHLKYTVLLPSRTPGDMNK